MPQVGTLRRSFLFQIPPITEPGWVVSNMGYWGGGDYRQLHTVRQDSVVWPQTSTAKGQRVADGKMLS